MADRIPQYSMLPHNFNPSLLQQQLSQQAQQQPQVDSQQVPGFTGGEHNRIWQQAQQMQNPYRSQAGTDMQGSQQQMADLIRSQNLARMQQQQMGQQQQQQPQQQYGLSSSQMAGSSQNPQQFHDTQSSQSSQQHLPNNFANMGGINASHLQAQFNGRGGLQTFQATQENIRQLGLMGLAQNQQPQNGPLNFGPRMAQQQQQQANLAAQQGLNPPNQSDIFSSPSMSSVPDGMHGSSPRGASQPPGMMSGSQHSNVPSNAGISSTQIPAGRRAMTAQELTERANHLRSNIHRLDQDAVQLNSQRGTMTDAIFMPKMQSIMMESKSKRDALSKIVQAIQTIMSQGNLNGLQGGNPGKPSGGPGHPQQQGMQGAHSTPGWPPQPGPSQSQAFPQISQGPPQLSGHGQPQVQNMQPSPSPLHAQPAHLQQQNLNPPRSGPTPHQLLASQLPNSMSPNMTNQFPFQMPGGPTSGQQQQLRSDQQQGSQQNTSTPMLPPPLEKPRFESAYTSYCNSKNISPDPRLMSLDGRSIDLHSLHVQVMREGGEQKVTQNDLWAVIGARIGFVQFPGTDTQPAISGPAVATRLSSVYAEYLRVFDNVYIHSVMESKRKMQAAAQNQQKNSASRTGPSSIPQNPQQGNARPTPAQQMTAMLRYAYVSAADLRLYGLHEKIIEFVEANRASLQQTAASQKSFRDNMVATRNTASGQPLDQQGMSSNVSGQFTNNAVNALVAQQVQNGQNAQIGNLMPPGGVRPQQHLPQQGPSSAGSNVANGSPMPGQFPARPQSTSMNGGPSTGGRPLRPNEEQLQRAMAFIQRAKQDFITQNIPRMNLYNIMDEQKLEYNQTLEQLHRYTQDVEAKLPIYCVMIKQDDAVRKLIAILLTAQHQRKLSSSGTPKYVVDLRTLQMMFQQIKIAIDSFANTIHSMANANQLIPRGQPPTGLPQPGNNIPPVRPQPPQVSQTHPPAPPPQTAQLNPPALTNRPVSISHPPPSKNSRPPIQPGPSSSPAVVSTPPPVASTSTPVANASTPSHAAPSPQTPKSPKNKAASKPKTTVSVKRRPSKAGPPPAPEPAPVTATVNALKRLREDEGPGEASVPNIESPPKKVKTEWEGPPSDALVKKQQDIENVKTEEDATAFWKQMTDLLEYADAEGQDSIRSGIASTLETILKGYGGSVGDATDGTDGSSIGVLGLGDADSHRESSPPLSVPIDEFGQFFDFSSFANLDDEDAGSKPPTPDLVSSSSTNPSPESGSEADAAGNATATASHNTKNTDIKAEELVESSELLRLGIFKEVDGGESAYYQQDNWKWDTPMATSEQPWAFFTS